MVEGLSAQHRPPFAYGHDTAPGDWGVIVHHMFNRDDYDEIDYLGLCPQGAELMAFVPNPCIAKAHGPRRTTTRTARYRPASTTRIPNTSENTGPTRWPPLITAAGPGHQNETYEEQLTQLICDHLALPALDRDTITVDRDLVASYF
ncbi:hypothetical protein [Streptomyces mirabilis]|uniref:hypothetical protein n=1 Tax=Streptomyces mirabilis TaxID=68239 RepID=UPI0036DFB9AF